MSYPARSNARSGERDSLWWIETYDGIDHVCSGQIGALVRSLQNVLARILPTVYQEGTAAWDRSQIEVDGNPGAKTLAGLLRAVEDMSPPPALLRSLQSEFLDKVSGMGPTAGAVGSPLTYDTMRAMIHVAQHRSLPWEATQPPTDMVTALFSVDPPTEDPSYAGNIHCDIQSDLDAQRIPVVDVEVPPLEAQGGGGDNALLIVALVAVLAIAGGKRARAKRRAA